jgi:hypothetical protein
MGLHRTPRGTSAQRGYGARHQQLRAAWEPVVAAGRVDCWRCGQRIRPRQPWDLGHDDVDRTRYRGPEHQACNRGASRRLPRRVTPAVDPQPRPTSSW